MKEIKQQVIPEVQHVAVAVADPGVKFLGKDFTMTCLDAEKWKWFHKGNIIPGSKNSTLTKTYDDTAKGLYHCEHGTDTDTEKYYFYVQGRGERLLQTLVNAPTVSAVTSSTALFFL